MRLRQLFNTCDPRVFDKARRTSPLLALEGERSQAPPTPHRSVMRNHATSFLLLLLLLNLAFHSQSEVISLTVDTFADKIKEQHTAWFVKFCVPWCKHCKNLGSLWDDLGKAMEGEDAIEIGEVDCSINKPVCSKVDIHSYPTFKIFYNGEEAARYRGPRDVESLKTFVLEEAEKASAKALDIDKEL